MVLLLVKIAKWFKKLVAEPTKTEVENSAHYIVQAPRGSLTKPENLTRVLKEVAYAVYMGFPAILLKLSKVNHADLHTAWNLANINHRVTERGHIFEIDFGDQFSLVVIGEYYRLLKIVTQVALFRKGN